MFADPIVLMAFGPLIGAALVGGATSLIGGAMANKASAKEAGKSRQFTERQLRNQHQWEVEDLKKAGLNPILSANSGAGTGPSASAQQINPAAGVSDTLINAMTAQKQMDLLEAQTAQTVAKTAKDAADVPFHDLKGDVMKYLTDKLRSLKNRSSNSGGSINKPRPPPPSSPLAPYFDPPADFNYRQNPFNRR